jgi:hypothetical protein
LKQEPGTDPGLSSLLKATKGIVAPIQQRITKSVNKFGSWARHVAQSKARNGQNVNYLFLQVMTWLILFKSGGKSLKIWANKTNTKA